MATKKGGTKDDGSGAAIAAGVLAAGAAAAAGYYFYGSKKAGKHRRAAVKWANDMKKDIVKEAKRIQSLDETVIHGIVDKIAGVYEGSQNLDPQAVKEAAAELKKNWQKVRGELRGAAKKGKSAVKKVAKKKTAAKKKRR